MRRCTGACRRELPETAEFFHRNGDFWAACCRECRNAERSGKRAKRSGDTLHGIGEVAQAVNRRFQEMFPNDSPERALRHKLRKLSIEYASLSQEAKARTVAWFVGAVFIKGHS